MKKKQIKNRLLEELRHIPIIQVAAEKIDISRNSIYRWKKEDPEFAKQMDEAIADGVALVNDMTESQLLSLVKEKSWPALAFWLKHRHPKFGEKIEVTAKIGKDEPLTPEQEKIIREALILGKTNPRSAGRGDQINRGEQKK